MYKGLSPGAVNCKPESLKEAIVLAKRHGFGGVEINPREVLSIDEEMGAGTVAALFRDAGLRPAGLGLPVDWRGEDEKWRTGLEQLPALAGVAASIGCKRCMTWVMPSSDDREHAENRRFHVERFTPAARILNEHGISLGLEFIGPKTMRDARKHPFIHKMGDMLELGREIGPNVGLLLDAWHWYTSGGTLDELAQLRSEQVVYVHVSDAPLGVPVDEQIDNQRMLPGETGVIDIGQFLSTLDRIGYDGPITAEPFKAALKELPSDDARLEVVARSLDDIFLKGGITQR
ncbi:MAG TPA: sugar phosphate isomerase/epimerase family protein [Chloroflexota bacterium]|nr:sugar phosphate isomerase/epimerase family protein [Chloroflexota bacterium]